MLSSASARPESIRDAGSVTTVVRIWFSTLCFLPLTVLPAVAREEGGRACPATPSCTGPAGPRGWDRLGCGALGERVRQNNTQTCLCWWWEHKKAEPRPCSQINFPDKSASLHHPGRAGRVPSTAAGKERAVLSGWAWKGIVSHCFPLNARRARGGSTLREERRDKVRSDSQL